MKWWWGPLCTRVGHNIKFRRVFNCQRKVSDFIYVLQFYPHICYDFTEIVLKITLNTSVQLSYTKQIPLQSMLSKALYIYVVDCASKVNVPHLPKDVVCHLDSTCTGISCCVYVELIHKNINIFLALEPCNNKIRFGIEKYQFTISHIYIMLY
jgi:hypothetical protein